MRNLSVQKHLVKNARLIVDGVYRRFIRVSVIDNRTDKLREPQLLPRIPFEFTPPYSDWTIQRLQFLLRLAYASTFHGCAGLTLNRTIIDIRTPVFAHGQIYTALPRIRRRDDSQVFCDENTPIDIVTNIVYKESLL